MKNLLKSALIIVYSLPDSRVYKKYLLLRYDFEMFE